MRHLMKPVVASMLALSLVVVFAGAKLVHYDRPVGTWLGFCEARICVPGLGDLVIQYWEIDDTPGLSSGDRRFSRHLEPCYEAKTR